MDDLRQAAQDAYWAWFKRDPNVSEVMERLYRVSSPPTGITRSQHRKMLMDDAYEYARQEEAGET